MNVLRENMNKRTAMNFRTKIEELVMREIKEPKLQRLLVPEQHRILCTPPRNIGRSYIQHILNQAKETQ